VRRGGDILRYNVRTNEFAVGAADGTIRRLFRPQDGIKYWLKQVGNL
jgi:pyocin large subunit-like protein